MPSLEEQIAALVRAEVRRVLAEERPVGRWVTVAEAAELLRTSPARIHTLRSSGRLTKYSEGRRALCDRAEVMRLVDVDRS